EGARYLDFFFLDQVFALSRDGNGLGKLPGLQYSIERSVLTYCDIDLLELLTFVPLFLNRQGVNSRQEFGKSVKTVVVRFGFGIDPVRNVLCRHVGVGNNCAGRIGYHTLKRAGRRLRKRSRRAKG